MSANNKKLRNWLNDNAVLKCYSEYYGIKEIEINQLRELRDLVDNALTEKEKQLPEKAA